MEVRKVNLEDIEILKHIGKRTFSESFASENSEEDMAEYLENGFSTRKLKEELTDDDAAFYFAELEKKVIGYLKVNFGLSQTEIQDDKALEIERIYVLKEFQGKSVGQALFQKAVELARKHSLDYIWLGVWEENQSAIRFYQKNGFTEFDKHIFKLGKDEQTDIMMKLNLD